MTEFIELIKKIGFVEDFSKILEKKINNLRKFSNGTNIDEATYTYYFNYNDYRITIDNKKWKVVWSMFSISDTGRRAIKWLEFDKRNFSKNDVDILKKHFAPELRDAKLKELGI